MLSVVFGSEKPLFLCGYRKKKHRPLRWSGQAGERLSQFQERSDSRGVVKCSVEDLITLEFLVFAEMIPVCRVDHVVILEDWIRPFQFGDDILRIDFPQG